MTPEQYWLLRRLEEGGSTSIGDLAAELGVTASTATIACKRLERAGLVVRRRQSSDERVVKVELTPAGLARLQGWRERLLRSLADLLEPLDPGEQESLASLVERVLERARQPERAAVGGDAGRAREG